MQKIAHSTSRPARFATLGYWGRYFLLFMGLFALHRLTFMLFYFPDTFGNRVHEALLAFWYALRLDAAVVAYGSLLPIVLGVCALWAWRRVFVGVLRVWFWLLYLLFTLACAGDVIIYREWGAKVHYNALRHLAHPSELVNTGTGTHFMLFGGIVLGFGLLAIPADRWVHAPLKRVPAGKPGFWAPAALALLVGGLAFVTGRGGFGAIAINSSQSYYSRVQILNDAAVNTPWSISESILENLKTLHGNPYTFHRTEELTRLAQPLLAGNAPHKGGFLDTARPNIVLVILESWSGNAIHYQKDGQVPTPYFHRLMREGWYWDQAYTVGWKSDFGVPGILSAWPCHENSSICMHPAKCRDLPGIARSLKTVGYATGFAFGGQLIYGNIKSYVMQTGFDDVREGDDLPGRLARGRLGVHDLELLQYVRQDLHHTFSPPFLQVAYTLSSHPPFDHEPYQAVFEGEDADYLNSLRYSDHALEVFMEEAKREPWYPNTLFVFVADHGRGVPGHQVTYDPDFFRIPVLFWGPALHADFCGKTYGHVCSQTDVVPTLLQEMGIGTQDYPFGRNIFHPQKQHAAFVTFCGGFHVPADEGIYGFDLRSKQAKANTLTPEQQERLKNAGEAYLQYLMDVFLAR